MDILKVVPKTCHAASAGFVDGQLYMVGANRIRTHDQRHPQPLITVDADHDEDDSGSDTDFDDDLSETSEIFDPETNTWQPMPPPPMQLTCRRWRVCGFESNQLGISGPMRDSWSMNPLLNGSRTRGKACVWQFDARNGAWNRMPPLAKPRTEVAVSSLDGWLYVCGGVGYGGKALACVERFNPELQEWQTMPEMVKPRVWAAAGSHKGKLMVCGGFGADGKPLACAEAFDTEKRLWQLIEGTIEEPAGFTPDASVVVPIHGCRVCG